jgi:hypothetical protein
MEKREGKYKKKDDDDSVKMNAPEGKQRVRLCLIHVMRMSQ